MKRTRAFFSNTSATALKEIVIVLCGFITPRIILKYYGSDINGLVTSIVQFIANFNIIEAGLGASIIYSLYKPLADKDYAKINGIVSAARRFYVRTGVIFTGAVLVLSALYPLFAKTEKLPFFSVSLLVLILGFGGALDFFTLAKYRALMTADQKTYVISISIVVYKIVETIIIVLFALLGTDIVVLRLLALAAVLARSLILYLYAKRNYKYIDYSVEPDNSALSKRWDAMYLQVLKTVQVGAPVVLLTIFTDLKTVSVYSIYNMVIQGIRGIFDILTTSSTATFGEILYTDDQENMQNVYSTYEFIYYLIITIVYSICMVMIMPFIRLYTAGVEDINYYLPFIGFLFVINGLFHNIKSPQAMLVNAAGMYRETRVQATVQAAIIFVGGLILVPWLGLLGMIIAVIASNVYRDVDLVVFASRHITKMSVRAMAFRVIRIFFTFFITWVPFVFVKIVPENFSQWTLYAVVVGLFAILIAAIVSLVFERKELLSLKKRAQYLIKNISSKEGRDHH